MEAAFYSHDIYTDPPTQFQYRYVRSDTEPFRLHYHDYYEIFLVIKGRCSHTVNAAEYFLEDGHLVFIRDFDAHLYRSINGEYFEFINLAFTRETFDAMTNYLGDTALCRALLQASTPPMVQLSPRDRERLFYAFSDAVSGPDTEAVRFKLRALLVQIFSEFFMFFRPEESKIPVWLDTAYAQMQKPQNFTQGLSRLYALTGKSPAYLARCFRKYYGTTPTEFINESRLNYCASLLLCSNLSVTDICMECGFENLSWFYEVFERKFGLAPLQYRKKNQNSKFFDTVG